MEQVIDEDVGRGRGRGNRGGSRKGYSEDERRKLKSNRLWKSDSEMAKMSIYERKKHARKQRACLNSR